MPKQSLCSLLYVFMLLWINVAKNLWAIPLASLEFKQNVQIMQKGGWAFIIHESKGKPTIVKSVRKSRPEKKKKKQTWQILEVYTKY